MPLSQQERTLSVSTPLGEDVLLLRSMSARERLSTLYEYELDLVSENISIPHEQHLGQPATVRLNLPDDSRRYFNGIVNRFSHLGFDGADAVYRATLVPWLWFLTRTADCRIFQEKTVPDIVKEIFREQGFTDFEERLSGAYRQWVYCVQYRETDFNFISRLLEQEGIYYFFKHEKDKHTLVLADSYSAHDTVPGYEEIPYYPPDETAMRERDHIQDWSVGSEVQPGVFGYKDFDFTAPKKDLLAKSSSPKKHDFAEMEIFDYPGEYKEPENGSNYARIRLEELQAEYETARAEGNARGLTVGALFNLTNYRREDQNREYLIVSADYRLQSDLFGSSGQTGAGPVFQCSISAIESKIPYRPPRITPKPVVQGPQTAIVVGKAGEEIWTEEYGQVKVQFHWDRYGKLDENSSCWVRVSHPWAGKGWGSISVPRIGQEVIVDFLEGDPDQPIITGRVYNQDSMPPYALPGSAVISGIKSNTHKGGGYNEISMDDTAGKEQVTTHAQYDMGTTVEHDQTNTIHNNRTTTVDVDDALTVTANRSMHVVGALTETIDSGQTLTVSSGYTETITGGATSTISGGLTSTVNGTWESTVNGHLKETVTSGEEVSIAGGLTEDVDGAIQRSASGTIDIFAKGAGTYTSDASLTLAVGGSVVEITSGDIMISSNGSTIKIDASGVSVNGAKISLNG